MKRIFSAKLPVILVLIILFCSCNNQQEGKTSIGATDSVMAKYKENAELQNLNKKIQQNPSSDSLYRERAKIYMKVQDFELAEGDAKRALNLDSSTSKNYLMLVDVYYTANQTRKAKETLERCLKSLPKDKDAILKLAELYFYVKKYPESIEQINKALEIDQYSKTAYFLKGMNYCEIGDTAKAISSYQTAVEQDNEYYEAYFQLGLLHFYKKNNLCNEYFDNALRLRPKSTEALYGKGFYFQQTGRPKEAKEFYERILTIDPKHVDANFNLGALALGVENNPTVAKKYFTDVINIDTKNARALYSRGVCNEKLLDKEAAINDYKMALKISENYEPAISALNKITGNKTN
ncbi:MAG: tetratricopeptide repeat protein [Bacteroidota bacterium]|jgi:tetratricopeptide (TPR) repeat protein